MPLNADTNRWACLADLKRFIARSHLPGGLMGVLGAIVQVL
jgi:hypothetical protein